MFIYSTDIYWTLYLCPSLYLVLKKASLSLKGDSNRGWREPWNRQKGMCPPKPEIHSGQPLDWTSQTTLGSLFPTARFFAVAVAPRTILSVRIFAPVILVGVEPSPSAPFTSESRMASYVLTTDLTLPWTWPVSLEQLLNAFMSNMESVQKGTDCYASTVLLLDLHLEDSWQMNTLHGDPLSLCSRSFIKVTQNLCGRI